MRDLRLRSEEEELMDDLNCSGTVVSQTLKELDTINDLLGGNAISMRAFKKVARSIERPLHVADLGCGSGDMMKKMAIWCRKHKIEARFTGVDANPNIVAYARKHTAGFPEISIECLNIFGKEFSQIKCDILHACLFTHHFTGNQLNDLFRQFKTQASAHVIINDLHRHPLAYYSIKWLTSWFSRSYMVQNDAATSVARGFKKRELKHILQQARIENYQLNWAWAFRWKLVY